MRRLIASLVGLALVAACASSVLAGGRACSSSASASGCGAHDADACGGKGTTATTAAASGASACGAHGADACGSKSSATTTAACESAHGTLTGNFDAVMSSVCRYACAAKVKHSAKDVVAQPGAKVGKLTQCPVSGVVFAVDADRPHLRIANADYVTCCDKCAQKLKANPKRYLRV